MKIKAICLIFTLMLFGPTAQGFAAGLDPLKDFSVDLESSYVSRYMFRGFDTLDDRGAIQPSLTLNVGETGLWFNFWGSFGVNGGKAFDDVPREDLDELDWSVGYDWTWRETIDFTAGYTLFQYPNIGRQANINEFFGGLTLCTLPLSPSFMVFYDFPVESGGPGSGFFYELVLEHTLPFPESFGLPEPVQQLELGATVGANDQVYDIETGGFVLSYVDFRASVPISLDCVEILPECHYQISTNHAINDEDEVWFGITVSKTF